MRLIDADALKEYFKTIRKYHVGKYSEWYLADVLEQQPTIDAVPVRHGKWENTRPDAPMFGFYYCSLCGRKRTSPQDKYCPNCGARMNDA